MKKIFFVLVALVLSVGLTLPMAQPVMAADIGGTKNVDPPSPNKYRVGDTINYVMSVTNPSTVYSMTVDVWDILPNGTRVDLDDDITLLPGGTVPYTQSYIVDADDIKHVGGENVVINTLRAEGIQNSVPPDIVDLTVEKSSIIIGVKVGTVIFPVNKFKLLVPFIGLLIVTVLAITAIVVRRRIA